MPIKSGSQKALSEIVDTIRGGQDEWWSSSSREDFAELARELAGRGFTDAEIESFLTRAYRATAREYGD